MATSRRVFMLLTVCLALFSATFKHGVRCAAAEDEKPKVVHLIIDYDDGIEKRFSRIAWKKGMTVLDALNQAKMTGHGIDFQYTGSADTAFLVRIDDVKNEGGGKTKRNWLYWVNDKFADRSFGVYVLEPSDKVIWKFSLYNDGASK